MNSHQESLANRPFYPGALVIVNSIHQLLTYGTQIELSRSWHLAIGFLMVVYCVPAFLLGWPPPYPAKLRIVISEHHIYTSLADMPQAVLALWLVKMGLLMACMAVFDRLFRLYGKGILFSGKNINYIRFQGYYLILDWVVDFLSSRMPKVKCFRPEGTYIMWMDFRGYGLSAREIHRKIYIDANVVLEGGAMFDPDHSDGFERICVPTRRALLQEALERIALQFDGL